MNADTDPVLTDNSRHNYDYDVDIDGPTATARVVRMVGHNKRVLELGAGPGSITKHLVGHGNCSVTAVELDEAAIGILDQYTTRIYAADLNDPTWPNLLGDEEPFEVIVAGDVLEHLYQPHDVLVSMKKLLAENGSVVISLPHIGHNAVIACLIDEDFRYGDWGLLDRTHIRFFGLKNIQNLIEDAGLAIEKAEFVSKPPEDTEFADKWGKLPQAVRSALSSNPFGLVYQVVLKAKPASSVDESLGLLTVSVEKQSTYQKLQSVGLRAARRLPPGLKQSLKKLLGRT